MSDVGELEEALSLSQIADQLHMKRSNVAKFLARRGVRPRFSKAQGYLWLKSDIDRVQAERESDPERMAADERRRRAALRKQGRDPDWVTLPVRMGRTQRDMLAQMARRPLHADTDAQRAAARRLVLRELAEPVPGEQRLFRLTDEGRRIAGML